MTVMLLVIGLIGAVWPLLVAAAVACVAFRLLVRCARRGHDAEVARRRRGRELAARADRENRWFLAGDPRGLYGEHGGAA